MFDAFCRKEYRSLVIVRNIISQLLAVALSVLS